MQRTGTVQDTFEKLQVKFKRVCFKQYVVIVYVDYLNIFLISREHLK
jgi:hypothetical protein